MRYPVSRRTAIRSVSGLVGIQAVLSGCTGGQRSGSGDQTTETTTQAPKEDTSGSGSPAEWRERMSSQAAEENGEVVYFGVGHGYDDVAKRLKENTFGDTYKPLTLNVKQGSSTELIQKYTRQQNQGQQTADVTDITQVTELLGQDVKFGDLTSIPGFADAPDGVKKAPFIGARHINPYGVAYNTDVVSDPPKSWDDLLDGRFSGKIIIDYTPATVPLAALRKQKGWAYIESLSDQDPQFTKSTISAVEAVANGDAGIFPLATFSTTLRNREKDLPIDVVKVPEMAYTVVSPVMMAADPPHHASAKLFIDWYMRPDNRNAQAAEIGEASLDRERIVAPDDVKELYGGKVWGVDALAEIPESAAELGDKFAKSVGAPTL